MEGVAVLVDAGTAKSRRVKIQLEENALSSGLRFVAITAVLAVVLGVGGFINWQHQQEQRALELARRTGERFAADLARHGIGPPRIYRRRRTP